jgi:hypothetical protein
MRPRDLFEVAIRVIGFIVVLAHLPQLVNDLIELITLQPHAAGTPEVLDGSSYVGLFSEAISASAGLLLLFGGRVVTRIVYGRDKN